jgi:hypothetical protein
MKKIFTLFFALVMVSEGFSQTYQNWDFSTSHTTTFQTGFVTWNLDGQTINSQLTGYFTGMSTTAPWSIDISDFNNPGYYTNSVAITASYFVNTAVPSSRWLVTPQFTVPTGVPNVGLVWYAQSLGEVLGQTGYDDNYRILVSTTDSLPSSFTPLLTVYGETGNQHALTLAAYAGQNIRIAFQDTSVNEFGLVIPGIQVVNLPATGATIGDIEVYEHNYLTNPVQITGQMTNTGIDTITNYTLNYQVNGGATVSAPITGVTYPGLQSFYYYAPTLFNPTTAGTYNISVWFSQINGTAVSSDTSTLTIFYYPKNQGLVKNVLLEEFTGAWCGYCPGGALAIRDQIATEPYVVPVAIHDQAGGTTADDAMQIAAGDQVVGVYASGFPTAMIDRLFYFDNQAVALGFDLYSGPTTTVEDTAASFRKTLAATPANVSFANLSFDSTVATNNLSVDVNATFLDSLSQGDYRLNLYLVEDSVITSGAGYDQHNYYASSGDNVDPGSPLSSFPAVITNDGQPNDWSQNHVLRAMAGGAWGTSGIIPSSPSAGATYTNTFTTTVSSSWRYHFITLVGVVQEYNTNINLRTILNVVQAPLVSSVPNGIVESKALNKLGVYPNPASSMAVVDMNLTENALVNISVVNALGQTVVEPQDNLLNAGEHTVKVPVSNLSDGLYYVKVVINGQTSSAPLSIVK